MNDSTLRIPLPHAPATTAAGYRRVLMLTYRFPPDSNSIASRRAEGLYKHLSVFGWQPHVITTQDLAGLPRVTAAMDNSLAGHRQSQGAPEVSTGNSSLAHQLKRAATAALKYPARLIPIGYDAYARWSLDAATAATQHGKRTRVDLVWATLSPLSLAPAAIRVARELGVPCVLDLRDPPDEALGNTPRYWFSRALGRANAVTVAAPSCITPYLARHAGRPLLVLSGAWHEGTVSSVPSEEFQIVHAGTWHSSYDATTLLQAYIDLAGSLTGFAARARLVFAGKGSQLLRDNPLFAQLSSSIRLLTLLPYDQASELASSACVLLIARASAGYKSRAITGKIYEYAPYEIPLLSIGGMDDLHAWLVRWLGGTWTTETGGVTSFLRSAFLQWQSGNLPLSVRNSEALEYLSQTRLAAEMASVFDAVVDQSEIPLRQVHPWPQ